MSALKLHGIIPPVVTPLDQQGKIDEASLRRVIRHLIDGGVHGLFLTGSPSAAIFPNGAERAEAIRIAVDEPASAAPLVAIMQTMSSPQPSPCVNAIRRSRGTSGSSR